MPEEASGGLTPQGAAKEASLFIRSGLSPAVMTGVRLRTLRGVVVPEAGVPLLAVTVIFTGAAFLAADLFLYAQMRLSLVALGAGHYVTVGSGLVASVGIIIATMPLLQRITEHYSKRVSGAGQHPRIRDFE